MGKFIAGLFTVCMVVLLAFMFVGTASARFNLVTIQPAFWLFVAGIVFVIGGGFVAAAGVPVGGLFATLGVVLLLLGGYKAIWPKTSTATSHAQEVADAKAAVVINKLVAPTPIRCDRTSGTEYWDKVTGEAKVFYLINETTHRVECADWKGFHAVTQKEYKPVIREVVELIVQQEPPPEMPKPIPIPELATVTVAPAIQATPIPDLTEWVYHITPKPAVQPTPLPDLSDQSAPVPASDSGWTPVQAPPR